MESRIPAYGTWHRIEQPKRADVMRVIRTVPSPGDDYSPAEMRGLLIDMEV